MQTLGRSTLAFVLMVAAPRLAAAQATHALVGSVTTDSAGAHGIGNVEILIPALGITVRTNWMGEYRIPAVAAGTYTVTARLVGYKSVTDTARLGAADARLDFVLDQKAVQLDSVVSRAAVKTYISPSLNGFEERMHSHAGGYFIGDSLLRSEESRRLSEVLASRVNGASFFRPQGNPQVGADGVWIYGVRGAGGGAVQCGVFQKCVHPGGGVVQHDAHSFPDLCYSTVWLDNVLLYDAAQMPGQMPPDLSKLSVTELGGVEFYPGPASTPAQFGHSLCGTLVLWTREK